MISKVKYFVVWHSNESNYLPVPRWFRTATSQHGLKLLDGFPVLPMMFVSRRYFITQSIFSSFSTNRGLDKR
ncbi:Uncharacterized protein HZ326_30751, partial [Fusarium oxysporum f. sp. albedinis]